MVLENVRRTKKTRLKRNAGGNVRPLPIFVPPPMFAIGIGTDFVQNFGAAPAFLFRPLPADLLIQNRQHNHTSSIYCACKGHLLPGRRGTPYRTIRIFYSLNKPNSLELGLTTTIHSYLNNKTFPCQNRQGTLFFVIQC